MGWSGSLTASSAIGSSITFTADVTSNRTYSVTSFTAPVTGIYRFILKGSGGNSQSCSGTDQYLGPWSYSASGGAGGSTTGYLLLNAGDVVYVGAGTPNAAAFVSKTTGSQLSAITKANLYFVAGAGGGAGAKWGNGRYFNYGCTHGGAGGGTSGVRGYGFATQSSGGTAGTGGVAGTQSSGYSYGTGQEGGYSNDGDSHRAGLGGDGLYGGYSGSTHNGGGGGSGYIYTSSLTIGGKTYTNTTAQGGGAGAGGKGSVQVTYYARSDLPIEFNGEKVNTVVFNGTEITGLVYNNTKVF